jgi:DNA-binding MarR family transcriptional regulator
MDDIRAQLKPTRDCLCSALRRASRTLTAHYERHFRGSGLRGTQFTILSTVIQTGGISVTHLAKHLGMERTTLTRVLRPLEERKLLRVSASDDGRVRTVSATARGESATRDALPLWQAAQRTAHKALAGFPPSLIKELTS